VKDQSAEQAREDRTDMSKWLKKAKRGFTLIELMIVVAIVGILAVLAIYGVRKYIANAKTAEARNSLGQIGKDVAAEFEKESMAGTVLGQQSSAALSRTMCATEPGNPVPATTNIKGAKYQSSPGDWNQGAGGNTGFSCLKFSMDQPQYYAYSYAITGSGNAFGNTFTATANGDLNGDGALSTFTLVGAIGSGLVLNIAPNMTEISPEE
jgi:type IV pilus assembly protein PilA